MNKQINKITTTPLRILFTAILLFGISFVVSDVSAQKNATAADTTKALFISDHMEYLMKDGGIWVAENPHYKKDEQYSAKTFKYEMTKGVHGENYRIKILSDLNSIGWYTSWDGYYLWSTVEKKPVYHSLGSNGAIANGTLNLIEEHTRINIFEIISYAGEKNIYKDVTKRVSDNEMHSESYQLNEKGEWEFNQKFIWKRVKGS